MALAGVTYGLIEGPTRGWSDSVVVTMLALGALAAVVFVVVERSSAAPMLPLAMFRVRQFTVTNGVTFLVYAALGGALFLLPVTLQVVGHYSPLQSGVALLPLTVIMLLLSSRSGRLAARIGPRLQMSAGPVVVAAGMALLARVADDHSYLLGVLPAVVVLGLGLATTVAPLTMTALGSVPDDHAGLASAVNNDVARVGSLVAVAILPALAGISGVSYLHPSQLAGGFRSAMLISAAWCAAGGVAAALGIRNPGGVGVVPEPAGEVAVKVPVDDRSDGYHCGLEATPLTVES